MSTEIATYEDEVTETGLVPLEDTLALLNEGEDEAADTHSGRLGRVSFFSSYAKGDRPKVLEAAGVKLGQFYLQDAFGVTPRDPFRIFVTPARFSCYATFDNKGKVVDTRAKIKGGWQPDRSKGDKFKDYTIALVLVPLTDDSVTAAFLDTTSGVERIWRPIGDAIQAARNTDALASRSPAFAAAAKAMLPEGRFLAHISTFEEPSKGDPKSKTVIGQAQIVPTPAKLVVSFNDYVTSEAFKDAVGIFLKRKAKLIEKQK